jgi:hypothetical protein
LEQIRKSVVFVELAGSKHLPDGSILRIAADGCNIVAVSNRESASAVLTNQLSVDIFFSNAPDVALFQQCRAQHPKAVIVLLTDQPLEILLGVLGEGDAVLVDHVISNRLQSPWTVHECRVTIQKIIRGDIFGLEKYLLPGARIYGGPVTGSACREVYNREIQKFVEGLELGTHLARTAFGICEELLMNAVYDAPFVGGLHKHHNRPRSVAVELDPSEHGRLNYGYDNRLLAISVVDPFGSLEKSVFFKYIRKVGYRNDPGALIDTKAGGAGLGLFKILFGAHSLVCNVEKGKKTEVIALIETSLPVNDFSRLARSIAYFETGEG